VIYENVVVYELGDDLFRRIREMDGISSEMLRNSLDPEENLQ
jgi:tetrahydromethanopterin S-methyltransferase subunit B